MRTLQFFKAVESCTGGYGRFRCQWVNKLDFSFSLFLSLIFFVLIPFFPLVAGLSLDFIILKNKSLLKNIEEGEIFKHEVTSGRKTRFSLDFSLKLTGFSHHVTLTQFIRYLVFCMT